MLAFVDYDYLVMLIA